MTAALAPLSPDRVLGSSTILEGEPACECFEDVLYDPRYFGLFDANGVIIQASAFHRGAERSLVRSHPVHCIDRAGLPVLEETIAYLGGLLDHYGHFLCTSLSRLWAWGKLRNYRALFHGWPYDQIARMGVASLCFEHHGLDADRVLQPAKPLILRRVIIPEAALDEQCQAFRSHRQACLDVGSSFFGNHANPIYLSKARLSGGVQRITNEKDLEAELASAGVDIVYPERLTVGAQIGLFSSGATILGSAGSAFHTQIFAERLGKRIVLSPSGILNSNHLLFDGLTNQAALYVVPTSPSLVRSGEEGGPVTGYELANPKAVAQELLRLI